MELIEQYIEALNAAMNAGADVRTLLHGVSVPIIEIAIDEEEGDLLITFLNKERPSDKTAHVPLRTPFTVAFTDYPAEARREGWE